MKDSQKNEVSQETMALANKMRNQAVLRELANAVFFLGMGVLLFQRLDYFVVLWFFLFKLSAAFSQKTKKRNSLMYHKLQTGVDFPLSKFNQKLKPLYWISQYFIGHLVHILVLLWVFSLLANPATKMRGANWLLAFAIIQLFLVLIVYLVNKKANDFIKSGVLPLKVVLWRIFGLSRPELLLLFWIEGFCFLVAGLRKIWIYDPESDTAVLGGILSRVTVKSDLADVKKAFESSSFNASTTNINGTVNVLDEDEDDPEPSDDADTEN